MKKFFLIAAILLTSCSTDNYPYQGYSTDFRNKSYLDTKHVGASCYNSCIYSSYAVKNNIQSKQYDCVEGPCACVKEGNAHELCEHDLSIRSFPSQENNINYESNDISLPYYNQYDNKNYGWATCQNTSIAMVLSHYEYTIHPDTIFNRWGKDIAQSPSGLNAVYKSYSSISDIQTYTNATPEQLKSALNQGHIVIVHGYFTEYGHVLVVKSFDGFFYYVNDPAGIWGGCFKCGYNNAYNGVTKYPKEAFENAVFTSDGYSYLPGWIHVIK